MEGDLGVDLILGRPFLRSAKARFDLGRGEIHFCVGKEDMFFKFKQMEEQRFMIQPYSEANGLWGSLEPQPKESTTTRSKRRRSKKVWCKVESSSSSTSPG